MRIPPPLITRRLFAAAFAAALAGNAALPPAFAMQGAAEMDAEFYLKGLLGLPTAPAAKSVPLAPPRELNQAFVASTLRALEGAIAPALNATSGAALREAAAARRKALQLEYSRVLYNGAFGGGGYDALDESGSRSGGDTLQYGFDLTLLSYWTLLADARLPRATTSAVSQQLGDSLLEALAPPALRAPPPPQTPAANAKAESLSSLLGGVRLLLDALKAAGYVGSWSLDDSDADDALWAQRSELSDTQLTVTLTDSASLRAAIVLNGRPGASPELARPLLFAYLRQHGARLVESNEYFLDSSYKSNPMEYRADQQVLTFTIRPAASRAV